MVDPRAGRFSQGFAAGGALVQGKFEQEQAAQQQQFDQRNLLKEQAKESAVAALEALKNASTKGSAAYFTSKGNNDQKGMDTAIAVQTRAAQELWKSTQQTLKATGHTEAEIANIGQQFRIAASLNNPAAEQKLIAAGEAEGKLASQQALEGQKQDAVQKQFLNSLDETVTQTKDGQFIDTQGKVITDVKKLNNLRNIPTTQNINQVNLTPANATDIEGDQLAGEQIAFEARELANRLTSADVGFRGAAGELLLDELLGQFIHSAVNKDRVKNRQAIRTMREKALRTMTTDNRLNREDRTGVEKIFPKDSVVESLPAAREKLTSLAELMEERSARAAGLLNRKATHLMSTEEIKAAVISGEMNRDQGLRALRTYHGYE